MTKEYIFVAERRKHFAVRNEIIVVTKNLTEEDKTSVSGLLERLCMTNCGVVVAEPGLLGLGTYETFLFRDNTRPKAILINDSVGTGTYFSIAISSNIPLYVIGKRCYKKYKR